MGDTALIIVIFAAMVVSIWLSYLFFMRGNTDKEKVAALLPRDFKPDWHYRGGDTYAGYESATHRVALVDWPQARTVDVGQIRSVEKFDESIAWLKHRWVIVTVDDPKTPRYRLWFQFNAHARDQWYAKLAALKGATS
jgi:hypothetical protein